MFKIPCQKCAGHGTIASFKHVEDGICFECSGSGQKEVSEYEYNDYKEHKERQKQQTNDDFEEAYYYFFRNFGRAKIKYKDSKKNVIKEERFVINGDRQNGFYIEIDGSKMNVIAKFKRTPIRKDLKISRWIIAK